MLYLSIAASDSSAGAGLQADLKTAHALGVYALTAVTAVTAQNTLGVHGVYPVTAQSLQVQLDGLNADFDFRIIKISALINRELVSVVAHFLASLPHFAEYTVIVDPIITSTSGASLLSADAYELFVREILPFTTLLTPNLPEAAHLLSLSTYNILNDPLATCQKLRRLGVNSVLLKGGHSPDDSCIDYFYDGDALVAIPGQRIETPHTHGTGCTLSAAIASYRCLGHSLLDAVKRAKHYLEQALHRGKTLNLGHGIGPLGH